MEDQDPLPNSQPAPNAEKLLPARLSTNLTALGIDLLAGVILFVTTPLLVAWVAWWETFLLAALAGLLFFGAIRIVYVHKRLGSPPQWFCWAAFLIPAIAVLIALAPRMGPPKRVQALWDFQQGTLADWGLYSENLSRVVTSPKITLSKDHSIDGYSLRLDGIDTPAPPKPGAVKAWVAVRQAEDLAHAKVLASVYVPETAGFQYADAKFFLFDGRWNWHESGSGGQGVRLVPGEWVELSWDLRRLRNFWWPGPWRNLLGIQIYVEGAFSGPVYIDNVKILK